jgi:hypothetical protein
MMTSEYGKLTRKQNSKSIFKIRRALKSVLQTRAR